MPAKKKTPSKSKVVKPKAKQPVTSNQQPVTDTVLLKAAELLTNADLTTRDAAFNELAQLIAPIDSMVLREEYTATICKQYKFNATVFKQLIKQYTVAEATPSLPERGPGGEVKTPMPATLSEYITFNEVPGILWKARKLLTGVTSPIEQSALLADVCRTIALYPDQVIKDHYIKTIAKEFEQNKKTLEKLVADHTVIESRKTEIVKQARKNELAKLDSNPKTFPFFIEKFTINKKDHSKTFKGIAIDIQKYLQFLLSFGFMRYGADSTTGKFNFVRLQQNVIKQVNIEEIKDFLEDYLEKEYDYDGAGCEEVDSPMIINFFLDNLKKYFSHDLFTRLRTRSEIIISRDTEKECFLYYKNGFVRITKEGLELLPYDKMDGSVWDKQMLDRDFTHVPMPVAGDDDGNPDWDNTFTNTRPLGIYADFIWRISGCKPQRFMSLCTILGYLTHDFYDYELKTPFLTDSVISEENNGRSGKSLALKMIGHLRSYCEIDGKHFDQTDAKRYEEVDLTTQFVHINDLVHKGRNKYDFELQYNEILEGIKVDGKWKVPFKKRVKMALSSNKSMLFQGGSMADRVVEFEVSNFFSINRKPATFYGKWFGRDFTETDWQQFDNFMCFCVQAFLQRGIQQADTINLEARKLLDGTSSEFLEFMGDIADNLKSDGTPWQGYSFPDRTDFKSNKFDSLTEMEFDKKQLYDRFLLLYPDFKNKFFTQKKFTAWLKLYGQLHLASQWVERRSNGISFIQFKPDESK